MSRSMLLFCALCWRPTPAGYAQEDLDRFFQPPAEYANDLGDYRSPLLFADGRMVKSAADWRERRREILETWHRFLGRWPQVLDKPAIRELSSERLDDYTRKQVEVEVAPDGKTVNGYLLVPHTAASRGQRTLPAVVVVYYDAKTGAGLGKELRDFGHQLARRGFVALSIGTPPTRYYPSREKAQMQPLSSQAYAAANCYQALTQLEEVDPERIGIVGHSYGGKWAMFASCLYEKFACAAWSDGGIVFDEKRANVNYWEPWYLGHEPGKKQRREGIPREGNPRTGAYRRLVEAKHDLHELHALMAPRPFLVSGGSEDRSERWRALNHTVAVNKLLGFENRVAMTNRRGHSPTAESNGQIYTFFERFLRRACDAVAPDRGDDGRSAPAKLEPDFESLFDGKSLRGWHGATQHWAAEDGTLVFVRKGAARSKKELLGLKLMSKEQYSDFILRFDVKLPAESNNGVAIRAPLEGDPAFVGMEIQIQDPKYYRKLRDYEVFGSIYGVVPAKTGHLKPNGEWNTEEIRCVGDRVTVKLNGVVIVDADLGKIGKRTVDGANHPGLRRKRGHIGFCGHTGRVQFRNIRIRKLSGR